MGLAEESGVVLNCVSFCWCIYDRKHFFEMFLDQLVSVRLMVAMTAWKFLR